MFDLFSRRAEKSETTSSWKISSVTPGVPLMGFLYGDIPSDLSQYSAVLAGVSRTY